MCPRATRLELMERFAVLARSTLGTEMDLHRAYAANWGITREALEQERPHTVTRGYTDFLVRTAALSDFSVLIAALLPCMWGYSELGQRLAQTQLRAEGRYSQRIEMYAAMISPPRLAGAERSAMKPPPTSLRKAEGGCRTPL